VPALIKRLNRKGIIPVIRCSAKGGATWVGAHSPAATSTSSSPTRSTSAVCPTHRSPTKANHDAIIDEATWSAVQEQLKANTQGEHRSHQSSGVGNQH
jgi:hypothetical protein